MEMPAFSLDQSAHPGAWLAPPFAYCDEVAGEHLEAAQKMRERLSWRLPEREHANVEVIQPKIIPVTFQGGIASLVIDKAVILEPDALRLAGRIIDQTPEKAKGLLLVEHGGADLLRQLHDKAHHFVMERFSSLIHA